MSAHEEKIFNLLKKASESEKSEDAMRFSQSALNCSHALQVLATIGQGGEKKNS